MKSCVVGRLYYIHIYIYITQYCKFICMYNMRAYRARGSVCVFRCRRPGYIIVWEITSERAYIQYVRRIRLIRRTTIRAPPLSAWRIYIYTRGGRTYIYARRVRARKTRARAIPGRILLRRSARRCGASGAGRA